MSIHPNAPHRPSKSTIADPQDLLTFLLTSEPRLRLKDAEREVLKRFEWWNPWKPEWRPPEFSSAEKDGEREVMKLDGRPTKSVVRRFFGKDSTASDISAKKRLGREQHRSGSDERRRGIDNLFEKG